MFSQCENPVQSREALRNKVTLLYSTYSRKHALRASQTRITLISLSKLSEQKSHINQNSLLFCTSLLVTIIPRGRTKHDFIDVRKHFGGQTSTEINPKMMRSKSEVLERWSKILERCFSTSPATSPKAPLQIIHILILASRRQDIYFD